MATSDIQLDFPTPTSFIDLEALKNNASLAKLERIVGSGTSILNQLHNKLMSHKAADSSASDWIDQIETVKSTKTPPKTVIGVVGATGSGKSSIINALLDQERILPTNCMRACTSVVTEISYNYDHEWPYRAVIKFISKEEWKEELKIIFNEISDEAGSIRWHEIYENHDSPAAVAYAKIKAVYLHNGSFKKEAFQHTTIEQLMQHKNMRFLDGQTTIRETTARKFYVQLQAIIDSTDDSEIHSMNAYEIAKAQLWPLVKVVRIYIKAEALATGAILVDLPGSQDSNHARVKVTEAYMAQCSSLWVVAPINRAVDSQAAKLLMGEAFKRQLQMDNNFGAVTFICSKTDDIKLVEATESLRMTDQFRNYDKEIGLLEKQRAEIPGLVDRLHNERKDLKTSKRTVEDDLEEWEDLRSMSSQGLKVYTPAEMSSKHKRLDLLTTPPNTPGLGGQLETSEPLTPTDIDIKITELRKERDNARRQKGHVESEIRDFHNSATEISRSIESLRAKMFRKCIHGRNLFAARRVQADFVDGIRDLDEQVAEENDEDSFDPAECLRDYDIIKANLPVFCVSSLAYQKFMGRFQLEEHVQGYESSNDTQIPQLREHCRSLTLEKRRQAALETLVAIHSILNGLQLWITATSGTVVKLTIKQKEEEMLNVSGFLESLRMNLDGATHSVTKDMEKILSDRICSKFEAAAQAAFNESLEKVEVWNSQRRRGQNITLDTPSFPTYKAVCIRNGVFANRTGLFDWNAVFAEPILRTIGREWELTFGRRVPKVLQDFVTIGQQHINSFHESMMRYRPEIGAFHVLGQQQHLYKETLQQISDVVSGQISTRQREINRSFAAIIRTHMIPGYVAGLEERGKGCFKRMKHRIRNHVESEGFAMFSASIQQAESQLKEMVVTMSRDLMRGVDQTWNRASKDYKAAAGGSADDRPVSEDQRRLRKAIMEIMHEAKLALTGVVARAEDSQKHDSLPFAQGVHPVDDPFSTTNGNTEMTQDDYIDPMLMELDVEEIKEDLDDMDVA